MSHPDLPDIMVAPNGARRTKDDHGAIPYTAGELAQVARDCFDTGAGAVHLHVRNRDGSHSLDAGLYREAMQEIATTTPEIDIQITTENAGIFTASDQLACLKALRPARASIALREIMPSPSHHQQILEFAMENQIRLEYILYSAQEFATFQHAQNNGTIPVEMNEILFVLGKYHPETHARPSDLQSFLNTGNMGDRIWRVCAFGPHEHACLQAAFLAGGRLRVGFENNICGPDQNPLKDNAESVCLLVKKLKQSHANSETKRAQS